MRQLFQEQLSLSGPPVNHRHARELEGVDQILRENPGITALVLQDLEGASASPAGAGRG